MQWQPTLLVFLLLEAAHGLALGGRRATVAGGLAVLLTTSLPSSVRSVAAAEEQTAQQQLVRADAGRSRPSGEQNRTDVSAEAAPHNTARCVVAAR